MARFQFSSEQECQYQRQCGGDWQRGPQKFEQRYAPYGKPQRCRDCGKKLDDGELVIEWLADADHLYWRTRKFIHAEPCNEQKHGE